MAQQSQRAPRRASINGSKSRAGTSSRTGNSAARSSSASRSRAGASQSESGAGGSRSGGGARRRSGRPTASQNGSPAKTSLTPLPIPNGQGLKSAAIPLASAAAGAAAGLLVRPVVARKLRPTRRVMGVPVPSSADMGQLSKQVSEAGKQFGRLANEVKAARVQAQKIGKALS